MNHDSSLDLKHATRFDDWYSCDLKDLSAVDSAKLLALALSGLQECTLDTLSTVTVNAVVNRIFRAAIREFPGLPSGKVESGSGDSTVDVAQVTVENAPELVQGLRFLIVKYITIIESLTGGVLTELLFEELSNSMPSHLEAVLKHNRGQNV